MGANEIQLQLLKEGPHIFNQWRQEHPDAIDLNFAKLGGANLAGADLSGANLTAANFRGADLSGANLAGADLYHADFTGAILQGVNFERADLKGAIFTGADLRNTNLRKAAVLDEIKLIDTYLTGADFSGVIISRAIFDGAQLTEANFAGTNLKGADFRRCILTKANFTKANVYYASFTDANLSFANFTKANLNRTNFTRTDLTGAMLVEADLTAANLTEANLTRANFNNANITGANFHKANLTAANIMNAFRNHEFIEPTGILHDESYTNNLRELLNVEYTNTGFHAPPYTDFVKCSVFSPGTAAAGTNIMVQVFAHCYGEEAAVKDLATQFDDDADLRGTKTLNHGINIGAQLTFTLLIDGIQIAESSQTMIWSGQPESVQFGVHIPDSQRTGDVIATIYASQNSIPFGQVKFKLRVIAGGEIPDAAKAAKEVSDTWKRYTYAFISYASSDRPEVLKRVQMLPRAGIGFFVDLLTLEPGESWEKTLYQEIDKSDVFFLFWSKAAKQSEWVMKEIMYALGKQSLVGNPEIIPIIIEGPPPVAPPPELKDLHFNDTLIYLINTR